MAPATAHSTAPALPLLEPRTHGRICRFAWRCGCVRDPLSRDSRQSWQGQDNLSCKPSSEFWGGQWLPQNIFAKALHASSKRKERERERERRTDGWTDRQRETQRELVDLLPLQFSLTPDGGLRVSCDLPVSKALTKALQEAMIMKRIFTSSGSDVSSVLEHLRSRAHMLGTSLSDPDHIRRKNPDALTRALVNPGNYFRLITARSELKEFQSHFRAC